MSSLATPTSQYRHQSTQCFFAFLTNQIKYDTQMGNKKACDKNTACAPYQRSSAGMLRAVDLRVWEGCADSSGDPIFKLYSDFSNMQIFDTPAESQLHLQFRSIAPKQHWWMHFTCHHLKRPSHFWYVISYGSLQRTAEVNMEWKTILDHYRMSLRTTSKASWKGYHSHHSRWLSFMLEGKPMSVKADYKSSNNVNTMIFKMSKNVPVRKIWASKIRMSTRS